MPRFAHAADPAEATPTDPKAEFDRGMQLLTDGQYDEACDRFERSLRLAYVGGSVLALARCRQLQGRQASAWQAFQAARDIALRDGREDRIAEADARISEIAPRLSRLAVIPPPNPPEGLVLLRNGVALEPGVWGIAVPVDGGTYEIEARAPGTVTWTSRVTVDATDDRETVRVPGLRPAPRLSIAPPLAAPAGLEILWDGAALDRTHWGAPMFVKEGEHVLVARAPGHAPWMSRVRIEASTPSRTIRIPALAPDQAAPAPPAVPVAAYVAGGVAVVGLGVGTWMGVDALRKRNEVEELCPDLSRCARGQALNDRAGRSADISTAGFAVGLAGAAVASYFLWLRPPDDPTRAGAGLTLQPVVGQTALGIAVGGATD